MSKYKKWYQAITLRGQTRLLDTYTESHHIIPKSLGGSDLPENLTNLTAREHFIAHWLLTKIYTEKEAHWKMLNAMRFMRAENPNQQRYDAKITARVYENLKKEYSLILSERVGGTGNPMYGKPVSEEVRRGRSERAKTNNPAKRPGAGAKISQSKIGKKRESFSAEWRAKLSAANAGANNNMYGKSPSEETRKKIGEKLKGRVIPEEERRRRGEILKLRKMKRERKICSHCQKDVAVNVYARFHGDRCKHR